MTTITLEIPGNRLPIRYPARIFQPEDVRAGFYSEITGPEEAFRLMEGAQYDKVRVIKPDLVEIKTFQVL